MPKVFPKNKQQLQGLHLNQKRHYEMTEEEKANVAACHGEKDKHICKNPVFRCSECGNYGCDQEAVDICTEQGFKNGKCLHCRKVGNRIPVTKEEYAKHIEKQSLMKYRWS